MSAAVELDDVHVHFGGVRAVDGVTTRIEPGTLCGLVGPNGSGKTTLLNAISGAGPQTSGTISIDGQVSSGRPAHAIVRGGLARTFQAIRLLPALSVRENVLMGADRSHPDAQVAARTRRGRVARRVALSAAADRAIARLDLGRFRHTSPATLSYGTQRRVEIARALAGAPRVLLLDEPVAGMNGAEREEIAAVIASLRDEDGLTQILVEHDLRMILALCDRMVVLNFGKRIAEGDPQVTAADPAVRQAYLGKGHGDA